jgi:hypothetical protein
MREGDIAQIKVSLQDIEPAIDPAAIEVGPNEWLIHIPAWVILDGNYANFAVGDFSEFALCSIFPKVVPQETGVTGARRCGDRYVIEAKVVAESGRVRFFDFGLAAYVHATRLETDPRSLAGVSWFTATTELAVDWFTYFDDLAKLPGVPPLIYPWTITGVWRKVRRAIDGPEQQESENQVRYTALEKTDALGFDSAHFEYLLRCRLESHSPKRAFSPAVR